MTKKERKILRGALLSRLESLPVSAFGVAGAYDPAVLLPLLFGPDTTVQPLIHCADLGAWVSGWTVVTTLPAGGGTHAFVLREFEGRCLIESPWANLSRGLRINVLTTAVAHPTWQAMDVSGLVVEAVRRVAEMGDYDFDFDESGALNDEHDPWVLRHALSLLTPEELETVMFLLSMTQEEATLARMDLLLGKIGNVMANWEQVDAGEEAVVEAVRRFNGVTLKGAQLERLGVAGALMTYPREAWAVEADRLVAVAYARGNLDEDFHPKPDPPKSRVKGGSRHWFPLAV